MSKQACWKDMAAKYGFCKVCGKSIATQAAQSCTNEECPQRLAEKDNEQNREAVGSTRDFCLL